MQIQLAICQRHTAFRMYTTKHAHIWDIVYCIHKFVVVLHIGVIDMIWFIVGHHMKWIFVVARIRYWLLLTCENLYPKFSIIIYYKMRIFFESNDSCVSLWTKQKSLHSFFYEIFERYSIYTFTKQHIRHVWALGIGHEKSTSHFLTITKWDRLLGRRDSFVDSETI